MKKCNLFLSVLILALPAYAVAQTADLVVTQGKKEALSFKKTGAGYTARSASMTLDIIREQGGYRFTMGGVMYQVKQKDASWKLRTKQGQLLFKVKLKQEKIKVLRSEDDPKPWEIKLKGDHYKIVWTGTDYGKIALQKDKNRLKVKDRKGGEIAEASPAVLSAAPAVLLVTGLSEQDRLLLFALLCVVGR